MTKEIQNFSAGFNDIKNYKEDSVIRIFRITAGDGK